MAVLISHQHRSVTFKYQNMCHSRSCVQHADGLYVTLRCLATKQSELATLPTRYKVCIRKVKNAHSNYCKTTEKSFDYYFNAITLIPVIILLSSTKMNLVF